MSTLTDDTLAGLLEGPRARGAFLLRSILNPPWSLRIEDRAPLSLVTMLRGQAWVLRDDEPRQLNPGDVAIIRGPDPYTIADDPATPPHIVIHPGQRCTTLRGEGLGDAMRLGVRTWGDGPDGAAVMLSGTYQMHSEVGRRLLSALPPLLIRPAEAEDGALISLLEEELGKTAPGQELVLDRILDLIMVRFLRAWLASPGTGAPAWYRAQHDPVVGTALRMLHKDPAHPWTVAELAAKIGVSRAALARRFTALVGEPPMNYLTGWRLALAADLLRDPDMTIGAVARKVGYSSPFALSAAFKRVRGISPQEYRRTTARDARRSADQERPAASG
ncbi:AraC family transcriptional regulator [Thermostaphylospora chromogena]|uniref:AraC-type DNA-binding protein n=1 Tax=Thermostaphylospora chromogena TaxID=35622 RepID=A0A1H1HA18_9ACTN|nr:AraC family transcriptional regulator [Thermostaphylospora chromogena]SDR22223.1 AraC-type DNA-binding protein [Thermostaphylospora chromogena]